jgi:hypothetical protein
MKGRREKWAVVTAAALFGVAFGILNLACGEQAEERTEAPASAKARPDTPTAPTAPKTSAASDTRGFDEYHSHVQDLGNRLDELRAVASGDLGVALEKLAAEQTRLMAELDAIGGDNEKWDTVRAELVGEIIDLRRQVRELTEKVNG